MNNQNIFYTNTNVILDWCSWTKEGRKKTVEFFQSKHIDVELYYIKVDDKTWNTRIERRNQLVKEGKSKAYYVCDNLKEKFINLWEEPSGDEDCRLIDE